MKRLLTDANPHDDQVTVWAPVGRDATVLTEHLREAGVACEVCQNIESLCAPIREGRALAIVAEEAFSDASLSRLSELLEEQPEWSEFPLILMMAPESSDSGAYRVLEAVQGRAHVTLLERPVRSVTLISAVRGALQSRQRQYQIRDELEARSHAEASLKRQKELLRSIIDAIPVMITIYDPELRSFRFNAYLTEILGWTEEDAADGRFMDKAYPDPEYRQNVADFMESGKTGWRDFHVTAKDGSIVASSWANIRLSDDTMIGIGLDMRERLAAELKLRNLNETLEQQVAERTATAEGRARHLRRLATELSDAEHRERTRLANLLHDDLQQLLLAVKMRLPGVDSSDEAIRQREIEKLDDLLAECLSTSRGLTQELSPPVLRRGNLGEVLEWLGGWFWKTHGLDVEVVKDIEPYSVPEHLRVFLFQAVRELLFNVVKHAGVMEARVSVTCPTGTIVVDVEDGGTGFDPVAIKQRLEKPESFGLFNIQERLEALEGRLEIRSSPGNGASFHLAIPLEPMLETPEQEPAGPPPKSPPTSPRTSRCETDTVRVLVVDDHKVVREGLVKLLEEVSDFEVVGTAADGDEAVEQAFALFPDVIVMDVELPGTDGVEATRRIKRQLPDTEIVGLSLHREEPVARWMLEAGAAAHLCKDSPLQELAATIRRAASGVSS